MKLVVCSLILGAIGLSGCVTYSAAAVSTSGKVYVVRTTPLGQDMLRCEVVSERPVCSPIVEK